MSTVPPVPMFSPDGQLKMVPNHLVDAAAASGGQAAVQIIDPTGARKYAPRDKVPALLKAGAKLAPVPSPTNATMASVVKSALVRNAPAILGTVGGLAGGAVGGLAGPPGALAGSIVGSGAGGYLGGKVERSSDPEWEGIKQAGYEAVGRGIGAAVGRLARPVSEPVVKAIASKFPNLAKEIGPAAAKTTESIGGEEIPLTRGQMSTKSGSLSKQIEHYTQGTFLGRPLRKVITVQEDISRQILAKLSKVNTAVPAQVADNWAQAVQVTRGMADPMYDGLADIQSTHAAQAGQKILGDEELARSLPPKARYYLGALSGGSVEQRAAESLGFRTPEEALRKSGQRVWDLALSETRNETPATVGDAIKARSELGDLAHSSTDANVRRMAGDARDSLDKAINKSLTPEQQAVKDRADLLWRRSYIMQDVAKELQKMVERQPSNQATRIEPQAFMEMVRGLARKDYFRDGGKVAQKPTSLDLLFDDPKDREAMEKLGDFLGTRYQTLAGRTTMGESMGRIGIIDRAVNVGVEGALLAPSVFLGAEGHIPEGAAMLAGMYILTKALANPGGPALVMRYLASPAAESGAIALRILGASPQGKAAAQASAALYDQRNGWWNWQ